MITTDDYNLEKVDLPILYDNSEEYYRWQANNLVIDTGKRVVDCVVTNMSDYSAIETDPELSTTEKALKKRELIKEDLKIIFVSLVGVFGFSWIYRKMFPT